jgi:hypothetical protein
MSMLHLLHRHKADKSKSWLKPLALSSRLDGTRTRPRDETRTGPTLTRIHAARLALAVFEPVGSADALTQVRATDWRASE